ncbi:UDP-glucose/GDP-mannose dehydrogenase family protein [soil metagenome]
MDLGIVGGGYVGLVTAACLAHLGHTVVCVDIDAIRVERLQRGELPIREPGLDELVADGLARGRLRFANEPAAIHGADLVIVCVGTLDAAEEWTDANVRRAVLGIASDSAAPRGIVIRSTLLPGTARDIARDVAALDTGARLAHNPEFTREAVAVADFLSPDRIVIGVDDHPRDPAARALADALRRVYAPLEAPVLVTDLTSAETIKLASNVFLATKITFANELARLCAATGADVAAVVDGMGMDARIGRSFLSPGPGFGGSCFPSQARALPALAHGRGVRTPLMQAVWPSNEAQAEWLIDGVEQALGRALEGERVALLGLTFKAGTDDLRESPALRLAELMLARGANVAAYDPVGLDRGVALLAARSVGGAPEGGSPRPGRVVAAASVEAACKGAAAVVVATEWPEFALLEWRRIAPLMDGDVVADGRHVVDVGSATDAGLRVFSLGVQSAPPP